MTDYVVQARRATVAFQGRNRISRLLGWMFVRRWRRLSVDDLTDHLLRDAGLERIGGRARLRLR